MLVVVSNIPLELESKKACPVIILLTGLGDVGRGVGEGVGRGVVGACVHQVDGGLLGLGLLLFDGEEGMGPSGMKFNVGFCVVGVVGDDVGLYVDNSSGSL